MKDQRKANLLCTTMRHIENPKISVAMATYNGEKYIQEQLESIIKQSLVPDEIIVCDDNSNDNTIDVIDNTLKNEDIKYSIIKHEHNEGVVKSFNEALKASTGDYVFLCDQDDYWLPEKVERFCSCFLDGHIDLVFSDAYIVNEKLEKTGRTQFEELRFKGVKDNKKDQYFAEMLKRNIFTGMCMAVSRKLINAVDFNTDLMLHDELLGWYAIKQGKISCINECLSLYRQHEGNTVGSMKYTKFSNIQETKKKVIRSTLKTKNKFAFLASLFSDDLYEEELLRAKKFYEQRLMIYNRPLRVAFRIYLKCLASGDYAKYTSSTENAKKKDFLIGCIC